MYFKYNKEGIITKKLNYYKFRIATLCKTQKLIQILFEILNFIEFVYKI